MRIKVLLQSLTLAPFAWATVYIEEARAATAGGGGLPMDSYIQDYTGEITGPMALAVGVSMMIAAGVSWHHRGHEMSSGLTTLLVVGCLLSMVGGAKTWYQTASAAGALI
jgi:type IV secretory pathway VirB2 component (pilin)